MNALARRFSVAALVTSAAFAVGVWFGWMLSENERP